MGSQRGAAAGTGGEPRGRRVPPAAAAVVIAVAAGGATWWSWSRTQAERVPLARTGFDFEVHWRCPQGHGFDARGAAGARPCPTCGQESFPTFSARCVNPGCGRVESFQLRYDASGKIDGFRWGVGEQWSAYEFPPRCRRCGADMRAG